MGGHSKLESARKQMVLEKRDVVLQELTDFTPVRRIRGLGTVELKDNKYVLF